MNGIPIARVNRLVLKNWNVWCASRWIVRQVSLSLPAGCLAVVAGRNGSGKSTFMRSLADVLTTREGWVSSGKCDFVSESHSGELFPRWNYVAYMGQSLTASDELTVDAFFNLAAGSNGGVRSRLVDRLDLSALGTFRLSELSGGQWQRVRLAQCLMKSAPVLLLDEPDAALDGYWRGVLWELLEERRGWGQLILVILHRPRDVSGLATHWLGFERGALMFCESRQGVFPEFLMRRLFLGKTLDSSECVD
jgi:ABC-type multidrug transport system ATPase subunit